MNSLHFIDLPSDDLQTTVKSLKNYIKHRTTSSYKFKQPISINTVISTLVINTVISIFKIY